MSIKVGVLRGGSSHEYEESLRSGGLVLRYLPEKYQTVDIVLSRNGIWHIGGMEIVPEKALGRADVILNTLLEDSGETQERIEAFGVPSTSSLSFASRVTKNKEMSKKFVQGYIKENLHPLRINTARHYVIKKENVENKSVNTLAILEDLSVPVVIKPLFGGASIGVSIAYNMLELHESLDEAFKYGEQVMVEEFVDGKEITCGVIESFREKDLYPLLPVEVVSSLESGFFDYDLNRTAQTQLICPGQIGHEESKTIQEFSLAAHKALGLRQYSESDFIVTPNRIFYLETNIFPRFSLDSVVFTSVQAVGSSLPEFLDHSILLALNKK